MKREPLLVEVPTVLTRIATQLTPHGRDCPDRCSLCAGATPRTVTVEGAAVLVDGQPARAADPGVTTERGACRRTGGRRRKRKPWSAG